MKTTSLDKVIEKNYGKVGTSKRDILEQELKMELLREEIKRLRKENNLTQEQLGKLIGVQRAHISKLENNATNITIGTLLKVLNALDAELNFSIQPREKVA
jgi:DNA-binding XRE family transcriptional regulator